MPTTRGELKRRILTILNKNSSYQGYYTDEKIHDAIQDCFDYIAVEMMMAGDGWMTNIIYMDTVAGQRVVEIPSYVAVINALRFKQGNEYVECRYDDGNGQNQYPKTIAPLNPTKYRIVDNKIYFNPEPVDFGTAMIELEYTKYPRELLSDGQMIDPQFDNAMMHYIKYRSCSIVAAQAAKDPNWTIFESQWYDQMMKVVNKRVREVAFVKEFQG